MTTSQEMSETRLEHLASAWNPRRIPLRLLEKLGLDSAAQEIQVFIYVGQIQSYLLKSI